MKNQVMGGKDPSVRTSADASNHPPTGGLKGDTSASSGTAGGLQPRSPGGGQPGLSWQSPVLSVWTPVAGKSLGILALLGCVAFLGHRAKEGDHYGPVVEKAVEPEAPPRRDESKAEAPSPPAHVAVAVPPRCPDSKKEGPAGITADGRVILNEATAEEMTRLPGVGTSRGEAIVKLRTRLGRFRKVSDLLRIRGIGWRTLKKLKDKVVLDRPAEEKKQAEKVENSAEAKAGAKSGDPTPKSG